jgi:hypothetical protein
LDWEEYEVGKKRVRGKGERVGGRRGNCREKREGWMDEA